MWNSCILGQVKEYDTPKNLMQNPQSEFYAMVQETGEQNAAYLRAVAMGDDASVISKDDILATRAKKKLVESANETQIEGGPLMRAIYRAAMQFQVISTATLCRPNRLFF